MNTFYCQQRKHPPTRRMCASLFRGNDLRQPHASACIVGVRYTPHLSHYWHQTAEGRSWRDLLLSPMCSGCSPSLTNDPASLLAPANTPSFGHVLGLSSPKHKDLHVRSVFAASSFPNCPSFSRIFPCPVHLFYHPRPCSCSPSRSVFTSDYRDHTIRLKAGGGGLTFYISLGL